MPWWFGYPTIATAAPRSAVRLDVAAVDGAARSRGQLRALMDAGLDVPAGQRLVAVRAGQVRVDEPATGAVHELDGGRPAPAPHVCGAGVLRV